MTTTVLAYIPSPSQGVWHLGPIPIRAYALFIIVGIIAALLIGDRRWQARGGEPGVIYDIALWAVPFGLVGGRLYHVITDWRTYFGEDGAGVIGALKIMDGGLGIWGAVALGGIGAWIGCRNRGIPLPAFGDAIAPGIVLAQAIGRLGNYFNQELYGRPTSLPWGLEIYERRNASGALDTLNGVSTGQLVEVVHPTFLYELLWNVLVFAALIYIDRRFKIGHGRLFATYVAAYCVGRFWVELMRSDVATHIAGIRINTFTSTFVFIGAVVYIMLAPKGREDPETLRGKHETHITEDTAVEEFVKELSAVGATSGIVAAAKVAGEADDEDALIAGGGEEPDADDEAEEPEESAEEAEAEDEEVAEGDQPEQAEDEAEEAEAEAGDEEVAEDAAPTEGLGAAEGDEIVEAEEAAPEVHEAAVEGLAEAEEVAEEVGAEEESEPGEADDEEPEAEDEEPEAEAEYESEDSEAPAVGLGAVEGDEIVEAEEAAPEVHEAAVEGLAEAEELAAEADEEVEADESEAESEAEQSEDSAEEGDESGEAEDDAEEPEPDEPDTEDAEAAIEAAETEPSEQEAAEEAEAVVEAADVADDEEPTTGVLEAASEPVKTSDPVAPAGELGGRLRRWLRRSR